jgi:hypothetical protein
VAPAMTRRRDRVVCLIMSLCEDYADFYDYILLCEDYRFLLIYVLLCDICIVVCLL